MRRSAIPSLILAVTLAGCSQDGPTAAVPETLAYSRSAHQCEHVTLHLVGYFDSPTTGAGTFTGDLEGTMTFQITEVKQRGRGATHLHFVHTFTTQEGSLATSDIAVLTPSGQFNERLTIVGGTGIYTGASGSLTAHGWIDTATGTGEVTYRGRICT